MIIDIKIENAFAFKEAVNFSLSADMRSSKLASNVFSQSNYNILKVAGVYGANNVGKTCLIKSILAIRNAILGKKNSVIPNIFSDSQVVMLGVSFLEKGTKYSYSFKYDVAASEYLYESFSEYSKDDHNNEKEKAILVRDTANKKYDCVSVELKKMLPIISKNNILINLLDDTSFEEVKLMKSVLVSFASKIDVVDMNNIPIEKTIQLLKNESNLQKKVVNFIKHADLDLEDFKYNTSENFEFIMDENGKPTEKVLDIPEKIMDQIRLVSVYKGKAVPSLLYDSTGTKKIAALASYIIEALEQGRILIIDELDSSIHFKLTRAIVAMFNNELNYNAQMVFTVHDINLMDCKRLFRKEQVWFISKDDVGVYLYSLADFKAREGVRDTTDIIEKYKKGLLGALPEPELINSLLSLRGDRM